MTTGISYFYLARSLLLGLAVTLELAVLVMVLATIGGFLLGLMQFMSGRTIRAAIFGVALVVRGVPLIVQIYAVFFVLPMIGLTFSAFISATIALSLFYSVTIGEIVRGGLEGVPRGQMQGALALGFLPWQAVRVIVLPQTLRAILPPLVNQYVSSIKGTALVSLVGVEEFMQTGREAIDRTLLTIQILAFVWLGYTLVCYPLTLLGRYLERRVNRGFRGI